MSGHSKWSTIKNKKEKNDNERAKMFTKISREIYVAVKTFGADVENNRKLRDLINKAKLNNLPNNNIERIIKKAAGDVNKNCYEDIVYEGYGPCGVAILVETLTDNRNRTASNLRHYFDKFDGKLATTGCVNFMFEEKGFIVATKPNLTEEQAIESCLEFELINFDFTDEVIEILVKPSNLNYVVDELKKQSFEILLVEVRKVANNCVSLTDDECVQKMNGLIEILQNDDDVQHVWSNLNI